MGHPSGAGFWFPVGHPMRQHTYGIPKDVTGTTGATGGTPLQSGGVSGVGSNLCNSRGLFSNQLPSNLQKQRGDGGSEGGVGPSPPLPGGQSSYLHLKKNNIAEDGK